MKQPLILRLKKESHKKIAAAQDIIMEELYAVLNDAVFHGGTAIWRCYQGQRFSEDIDIYIPRDLHRINLLFQRLEQRGFIIEKKKIGEHSLYSNLLWERTSVRLEAFFKKEHGILKEYETVEGNFLTIYTLTPEEFIAEKVAAYRSRLKVRDLYNIFFLLRYVANLGVIQKPLQELITHFRPPVDPQEMRVLIIEGIIPTYQQMLQYIQSKVQHG